MLPKLFKMEDYKKCIDSGQIYCKADGKLYTNAESNTIWEEILKMKDDRHLMDKSLIHRGLCLDPIKYHNDQLALNQCERLINQELEEYSLISHVYQVHCLDGTVPTTNLDSILMLLTFVVLSIILIATITHRLTGENKNYFMKLLYAFSLQHTWKKITSLDGNQDFIRLKGIQGIRVCYTMLIMFMHSKMFYAMVYWKESEKFEEVLKDPLFRISGILDMFLVQPFLFISTFLLTNQIYTIVERNKKFTFNDVLVIIINRFFRLGVTSAIIVLLISSSFLRRFSGVVSLEMVTATVESCRNNWLSTIFFYSNYKYAGDICNAVTWTNSVDFQMYISVSLLLYATFKLKLRDWVVMMFGFFCSMIVYGYTIYQNNLDIIFRVYAREIELSHIVTSLSFYGSYMSTISVWSTSFLGMILGAIYYKTKNLKIHVTWFRTCVGFTLFFILPTMVIIFSQNEFYGTAAAVIGPFMKPLYALGIGIGILGMSHNFGGIVKNICEWTYIVILSNFVYCSYLCNWILTITSYSTVTSPIEISPVDVVIDYFQNVTKTLVASILLTVAIEQPGLSLQKLLLPQIPRIEEKKETKGIKSIK